MDLNEQNDTQKVNIVGNKLALLKVDEAMRNGNERIMVGS